MGMLMQTATETAAGYTGGVRSRIEYQRRIRQIEGPGPVERAVFDYFIMPVILVLIEIYRHMSAFWRVNEGFAKKVEKTYEEDDDNDKKKRKVATWHELELLQYRVQTVAALAALLSVGIAVIVNELQFRGFIPGWTEDCSNPDVSRLTCKPNPTCSYDPTDYEISGIVRLTCLEPDVNKYGFVDRLKYINTANTGFIIFATYIYYRYEANIFSLRVHTEMGNRQLTSFWLHQCGLLKWFLLEAFLLLIQQVPAFYYDVIVQTSYFSSRPSVYSVDGIIAILMGVRIFQIWKWYRGYLYTRFTSRRHAIRLNDEETGSTLAVKLFVLENPVLASTQLLIFVILIGSFVYRIAESSTNEAVGVYYWDCMWFMIDAMTGLPIADKTLEPEGTFGRVIAVIVRIFGVFWFILVLSAIRQVQVYDVAETQFFGWIRISSLNTVVKISAARVIQYMWIYGIDHWSTLRQLDRFRLAKQNFKMAQNTDPEQSDFEVFKRSLTTQMKNVKKLLDDAKEGMDKRETTQEGQGSLLPPLSVFV